ncbi:LytTR family DNA-binding domain-containing protein [Larkinella ripae]
MLVDDEPIALDVLATYVRQVEGLELAGRCRSAVEAFTFLQQKPVDLLLLDIQMPQLSGLDLLRTLPHSPKTIITSAYREYALDGFELDVVDYLIKPIPFDRFIKAVGKVFVRKAAEVAPGPVVAEEPFLFVKEERHLVRVALRDIISLESLRDYVKITTVGRQVVTRQTLGYYEELLPDEQFLRIHRSFMVARDKIVSMTENRISLPGQTLPIGRFYKARILEQLQIRDLLRSSPDL